MRVVLTGLAHLFYFTRHFRAGLSYFAATQLEFWWCLLHRLRSVAVLTITLLRANELKSGCQLVKCSLILNSLLSSCTQCHPINGRASWVKRQ